MGVTGVLLLAESHISIHTWPEFGFAAADIFMCGAARPRTGARTDRSEPAPAIALRCETVERGQL